MATDLTALSPATLAALAKVAEQAAKATRATLEPGAYKVSEKIAIDLSGTVNVGEDYEQKIVGKAKPWNLVAALLEEANRQLTAAGLMGIDLARVVQAAEQIDPEIVNQAQAAAEKEVAAIKAPTVTECKGKVTIKAHGALPA
jgi:hypothetical protein